MYVLHMSVYYVGMAVRNKLWISHIGIVVFIFSLSFIFVSTSSLYIFGILNYLKVVNTVLCCSKSKWNLCYILYYILFFCILLYYY